MVMLNAHIIKVAQNKGVIPVMIKSRTKISITQIIAIFITSPNIPKVIKRKGKVIKFNTGLIKAFTKPKNKPHHIKVCQESIISTPGTNSFAKNNPKTPTTTCKINLNKNTINDSSKTLPKSQQKSLAHQHTLRVDF